MKKGTSLAHAKAFHCGENLSSVCFLCLLDCFLACYLSSNFPIDRVKCAKYFIPKLCSFAIVLFVVPVMDFVVLLFHHETKLRENSAEAKSPNGKGVVIEAVSGVPIHFDGATPPCIKCEFRARHWQNLVQQERGDPIRETEST